MKKLILIMISLSILIAPLSMAESILPSLSNVFSVEMPSLRQCAQIQPQIEETLADGSRKLTFFGITEEIYNRFNRYLGEYGCTTKGYTVNGSIITITIANKNATFTFEYHYDTEIAVVIYPVGTREEAGSGTLSDRPAAPDTPDQSRLLIPADDPNTNKPMSDVEIISATYTGHQLSDQPLTPVIVIQEPTIQIGSYVTFGAYPQTANGYDRTPIEWLVLDIQGSNALLVSRYGLDAQPYNSGYVNITWKTSGIRGWLNQTFLNKAFTLGEQSTILTTQVQNTQDQCVPQWDTFGGSNCEDKIFLLSYEEAWRYFSSDAARITTVTPYAAKRSYEYYDRGNNAKAGANCWWWLRSPGPRQDMAADVDADGTLLYCDVFSGSAIVRPAMWVDLKASHFAAYSTQTASVTFGSYPQGTSGTDRTPIEWQVLEAKNGTALLISRYGLNAMPYSTSNTSTWENSSIRSWLNNEFFNTAFTAGERSLIQLPAASDNLNTSDRVFLLSVTDMQRYFRSDKDRLCVPTNYAISQGASTASDYNVDGHATGWWWTRTPSDSSTAYFVDRSGILGFTTDIHNATNMVRPVIRVKYQPK